MCHWCITDLKKRKNCKLIASKHPTRKIILLFLIGTRDAELHATEAEVAPVKVQLIYPEQSQSTHDSLCLSDKAFPHIHSVSKRKDRPLNKQHMTAFKIKLLHNDGSLEVPSLFTVIQTEVGWLCVSLVYELIFMSLLMFSRAQHGHMTSKSKCYSSIKTQKKPCWSAKQRGTIKKFALFFQKTFLENLELFLFHISFFFCD